MKKLLIIILLSLNSDFCNAKGSCPEDHAGVEFSYTDNGVQFSKWVISCAYNGSVYQDSLVKTIYYDSGTIVKLKLTSSMVYHMESVIQMENGFLISSTSYSHMQSELFCTTVLVKVEINTYSFLPNDSSINFKSSDYYGNIKQHKYKLKQRTKFHQGPTFSTTIFSDHIFVNNNGYSQMVQFESALPENIDVTVVDLNGISVLNENILYGRILDLSSFTPGIYIVMIKLDTAILRKKIILF